LPKPLDPKIARAITDAVHELEGRSCAEVVVEIRSRSGPYGHAEGRVAALVALVALLVLLFSPWTFAPPWVVIDVVIAYFLGLFAARRSDVLRRLVTSARERATSVRTTAAAVFHERGIANTESETGMLVYLSLLERRIEILADRGVLKAVPPLTWNQLLDLGARHGGTAQTLVEIVRGLAPLLEQHLPARAGDTDELSNAPRFVHE
jgi:putative membrane protein